MMGDFNTEPNNHTVFTGVVPCSTEQTLVPHRLKGMVTEGGVKRKDVIRFDTGFEQTGATTAHLNWVADDGTSGVVLKDAFEATHGWGGLGKNIRPTSVSVARSMCVLPSCLVVLLTRLLLTGSRHTTTRRMFQCYIYRGLKRRGAVNVAAVCTYLWYISHLGSLECRSWFGGLFSLSLRPCRHSARKAH